MQRVVPETVKRGLKLKLKWEPWIKPTYRRPDIRAFA